MLPWLHVVGYHRSRIHLVPKPETHVCHGFIHRRKGLPQQAGYRQRFGHDWRTFVLQLAQLGLGSLTLLHIRRCWSTLSGRLLFDHLGD